MEAKAPLSPGSAESSQPMSEKTLRVEEPKETSLLVQEKGELKVTQPGRKFYVDAIMIVLTYVVFVFHLNIYYNPFGAHYYTVYPNLTKIVEATPEDPYTITSLGNVAFLLHHFLNTWVLPMFFFLSGQNAYSALFKRSGSQFRTERVHRLLAPALFLAVITQILVTFSYFSPSNDFEGTYLQKLQATYRNALKNFRQAWFLLYLFIYAQMFTFWFKVFHPAHNKSSSGYVTYCESSQGCCTVKPFNCLTRVFCCLNFLGKPASTPQEFVQSVKWFLGGPFKLALVPALLLGVVQTIQNFIPLENISDMLDDGSGTIREFRIKPFFSHLVVYVLGYATATAENEIKQESKWWAWTCLILGTVLCICVPFANLLPEGILRCIVLGFTDGMGQWLFLMGSLAFAKNLITEPKKWHTKYRMMAMPFYVIHIQILVIVFCGALWVPYLRTYPIMLIVNTLLCFILSYAITKSGSFRYFFGLPPPKGSILPGHVMKGFLPVTILGGLYLGTVLLANLL